MVPRDDDFLGFARQAAEVEGFFGLVVAEGVVHVLGEFDAVGEVAEFEFEVLFIADGELVLFLVRRLGSFGVIFDWLFAGDEAVGGGIVWIDGGGCTSLT